MSSVFAWPNFASTAGDADTGADQARQRGYEAGYQQGLEKAQAEQVALRARIEESLAELAEARVRLGGEHAASITEMAFAVLEALMQVELRSNPALIESMVAEALVQLGAELDAVTVHVHPTDLTWLQGISELEFVADDSVVEGGLSVRLPQMSVEFDLLGRVRDLEAGTIDVEGDSHPRVT